MDFERYVEDLEEARQGVVGGGRRGPDNLVVLASTVSTNLVARGMEADYASEGLDLTPTLVLAYEQLGGRGRQGREWVSPRGRGVYATLVAPYGAPALLPTLPLLVGVGLCRALAPHLPAGCQLKWPNDLMVPTGDGRGKKIGGVLIEALVQPGDGCVALIGFGVNHGQRQDELPSGATSLLLETAGHIGGKAVGLARLTWDLVVGVEAELARIDDAAYAIAAYSELAIHRPGDPLLCRVGGREIAGAFAGFDAHGHLRLRRLEGEDEELISAGEVIEQ